MGSATAIPFKNPATATLFELVKSRRTFYDLEAESPIPDSTIDHVVKNAILHVPSSFNTQTTRAILLLKGEHRKLWDATIEIMEGLVAVGQISHEAFCTHTKPKLEGFRGAYGTVLFFVDYDSLEPIKAQFAQSADKFDPFALESNAMSQYLAWVALESEGFGANLQHYNPLVDSRVHENWNVPRTWKIDAQLVFGTPKSDAREKTSSSIDGRYAAYGL